MQEDVDFVQRIVVVSSFSEVVVGAFARWGRGGGKRGMKRNEMRDRRATDRCGNCL